MAPAMDCVASASTYSCHAMVSHYHSHDSTGSKKALKGHGPRLKAPALLATMTRLHPSSKSLICDRVLQGTELAHLLSSEKELE